MRKRGEQGRRKRRGIGEVKADRYSRTDQVAEARAVASALGQVLSRVGSLEPVRLVSVFASIVPSFENLRQPVLLPLAFFPASQLPARLARHPFSVFSPPIRVFLSSISFTGPLPLLLSTFFPPPRPVYFFLSLPNGGRPRQNPLRYRVSHPLP